MSDVPAIVRRIRADAAATAYNPILPPAVFDELVDELASHHPGCQFLDDQADDCTCGAWSKGG